ncbi:MAG: trypsin-like serine protease [Myxococcota bacterium]|nr:trypsin-like serine protease [Myxococcota bacterium]
MLTAVGCVAEGASEDLATADSQVIGGTSVPVGQWQDVVAVLGASGVCTGTLIAPTVVLTAAHCDSIDAERVVVGASDYRVDGVDHEVASFTAHPTFDVAVIVLATPVVGIAPRRIATSCTYDGFAQGMPVQLVGFGRTDQTRTADSKLHEAMVTVRDPSCMGGRGCNPDLAPNGEFVAAGESTNSCFGDSGGPVYLETPRGTLLIGAVSRGVADADAPCSGGAIYSRVDKVAAWIESTAAVELTTDSCDVQRAAAADDAAGCSTGGRCSSSALLVVLAVLFGFRRGRTAR